MKIVVYTKYGTFESKEQENTDEIFNKLKDFLSNIANFKYISIETEKGFIYMNSNMINDSLFSLERN